MQDPAFLESTFDLNREFNNRVAIAVFQKVHPFATGYDVLREKFREHGIHGLLYSTMNDLYWPYYNRMNAWDRDSRGQSFPCTGQLSESFPKCKHMVNPVHPAFVHSVKDRMDKLLKAGITTWLVFDYNFPARNPPFAQQNGAARMGFAPEFLEALRIDLADQDEGLHVVIDGQERVWHFSDYCLAQLGFRVDPRDVGLLSWQDLSPPATDEAAAKLPAIDAIVRLLRAYEWLKLPDWAGRYYAARGGNLWVMPNQEAPYSAADFSNLARVGGVANLMPEIFGNIALNAEAAYSSYGHLSELARDAGHRLSVNTETGVGGHILPYTDFRIAYNAVYVLTGAGQLSNFDNDFINEVPFKTVFGGTKPAGDRPLIDQRPRFRDALAKTHAFFRSREEHGSRPAAQVLCCSSTCATSDATSIFYNAPVRYSFAAALNTLHVPYDHRSDMDIDRDLEKYSVIAYANTSPKVGTF